MQRYTEKLLWAAVLIVLWAGQSVCAQDEADEPKQPAYNSQDMEFKAQDDVPLYGRLVLPKSKAPRAIVVYVQTAEGATIDMKRPLGGGRTFNYYDLYREKLTEMNIGFFSYEGRGIRMGEKPPRYEKIDWEVYNTSTLENKVRDLLTAVETVRKQKGLEKTPILLLGASEATLLAAEAASRNPEAISGLALYGVLVKNLRYTFAYIMSDGAFLRYRPLDEDKDGVITKEEWDKVVKGQDFSAADFNKDEKFTVDDIKVATKKYLDAIEEEDYEVLQAWAKAAAGASVPEGWFKDHFEHADNWSFLSKLDIPVGCFHGDADNMTPIGAVKELEAKAKEAKLNKMEFHYFEGADHSLNIALYFLNGKMPKGHQAIFEFIDRVAPKNAKE